MSVRVPSVMGSNCIVSSVMGSNCIVFSVIGSNCIIDVVRVSSVMGSDCIIDVSESAGQGNTVEMFCESVLCYGV